MDEVESKKAKGKRARERTRPCRAALLLLPFYFYLFTFSAAAPAAVQVYARVDAETAIYPGQEFVYSVVVEGGGRPSQIDISPLAPFHPRPGVGDSTVQTIVNGRMTIAFSRGYAITADKVGVMHLRGVKVIVDGQTYTTNPVDVTVSPPGTTDRMSLEFRVSDPQCYVGQPLVMTVEWTISARFQDGSVAFDVPVFKTDDFYVEDVSEPAGGPNQAQLAIHDVPVLVTQQRRLVRGMEAAVFSFRKVLIPKRAGPLRLDPLTVSANLPVGRERADDFFSLYRTRFQRFSVQSNAVELDVRPLPEAGKPPQFYGLVGPYTISASATPTKVSVGDPITLTIRIGGNPFLKPVQWPALEQVPELASGFKIPAEKASPVLEGGSGSPTQNSALGGPCKVFTQTIRANRDTVTQVPAIPLAYFDPQQRAYVVAKTEPIELDVAPSKVLTNVDVQGTAAAAPVNREVEAIRKGLSANYYGPEVLENQSISLLSVVTSPVYAALWSIPLLGLIISSVVKLAGRTSPESLARKRRRRAAGTALTQLKQVNSAEPGRRHELLLSAMKGYIGDRFDKVAASLTADDCYQALVAGGDAVMAARYKELIDVCEAARYAPLQAKIGPDQVQAALELIQAVDKAKPAVHTSHTSCRSSLLLLPLCLAFGQAAKAAPSLPREQLHSLLQEANVAFQTANAAPNPDTARPLYDKAILLYEKLVDQGGIHNAKLYYNLANAYLLKEDLGRAILNYRRAAQLDRSDLNIQKNLAFARSRRLDRVETSAERRVLGTLFFWHYDFSLKMKLLLATLSFAALCGLSTLMVWRGRGSAPLVAAVLAGVFCVAFTASVLIETKQAAATRSGVITAAEVAARQGDGPNYPPSFKDPLHAGLEFELREQRPGWLHIELSNGTDAWIPADAAGLV